MGFLFVILGLAFALLAHFPVKWFVHWLRSESNVPQDRNEGVPVWIVGTFERLLAFSLVCFDVEATYTILIAWMAAKLAANWQRQPMGEVTSEGEREIPVGTFIALMAGTFSLALGAIGKGQGLLLLAWQRIVVVAPLSCIVCPTCAMEPPKAPAASLADDHSGTSRRGTGG